MTWGDALLFLLPVLILVGSHEWGVRQRARRASLLLDRDRRERQARARMEWRR